MPTLSTRGDVTYGWAGGPAYLNNQPIGPGAIGPWPFIVDALNCGQVCDADGCRVCSNATGLPTLVNVGADWIVAGGGRWASFHDFTLQDSARPGGIPDQYPLAMSEDGALATFNYRNGQTVIITNNADWVVTLPVEVLAVYGATFRSGVLAFQQTGLGWVLYFRDGVFMSFNRRTDGIYQCIPTWINGELWLTETNAQNIVTIRRANSWTAYIIDPSTAGAKNHVDARQIQDGRISIVWCSVEWEAFGSLVRHDLTLDQILALPTMDTSKPPIVLPPQPTPKPPLQPLPDGPFPPCWIGLVSDRGRGGGNCTWSPSPSPTDTRPVTETSAGAATIMGRAFLHGLCLTDQNASPDSVNVEIDFTKAKQAHALYIHRDAMSQDDTARKMASRVSAASLKPLIASHVLDQVNPDMSTSALTFNLRTVGRNLTQLAANWAEFVRRLQAGQFEVAYLSQKFERNPENDLAVCWPELDAQVAEVLERIPTPKLYPGAIDVPPVVDPPPVIPPPVVNPKPPRPPSKWAAILAILKAIFGKKH